MATIKKRKYKNGKTRYQVIIRLKGHPTQIATFTRITDAKKWEQQIESAIREGRHFKTSESKKHNLQEMIDRYIAQFKPDKCRKAQLIWWKNKYGSYLLSDLTPSLIAEGRDELLKGITTRGRQRSNSTTVRYLSALSHVFTVAIKEWGWVEDSPMRKITKPKEPRGRVRFLDEQEREALLKACKENSNPYLYIVVILALSTGMRQGEIMNLKWADINFQKKQIILHKTKNGERRVVPLAGHALELLQKLDKVRRIDTDLLFPGKDPRKPMDLRFAWEQVLKISEIKDFRFHDLRHCAASYLLMSQATLAEIAEVLGHKTLAMVKRYAHMSEAHAAAVVSKMNEVIFG